MACGLHNTVCDTCKRTRFRTYIVMFFVTIFLLSECTGKPMPSSVISALSPGFILCKKKKEIKTSLESRPEDQALLAFPNFTLGLLWLVADIRKEGKRRGPRKHGAEPKCPPHSWNCSLHAFSSVETLSRCLPLTRELNRTR